MTENKTPLLLEEMTNRLDHILAECEKLYNSWNGDLTGIASGTITLKANTSTSTAYYSSCQQVPTYPPVGSAAIGNKIEITLGTASGGAILLPPPVAWI